MGLTIFPQKNKGANGRSSLAPFNNEMLLNEMKFKALFDHYPDAVFTVDLNGKIVNYNQSATSILGFSDQEISNEYEESFFKKDRDVRSKYFQLALNGKAQNFQAEVVHKNGMPLPVDIIYIPIMDDNMNVIEIHGIFKDITKNKVAENKLNHIDFYDSLTELPNRRSLDRKIESLVETAKENEETFSIMFIDLDRFNTINETLGYAIGDKVLKEFSVRTSMLLSHSSLFARSGGDRFGIALWDYELSNYPETLAQKIINSLKEPFLIDKFEIYVTASIGISTYPTIGDTLEELVKNTDAALSRVKAGGKNNYHICSSSINISSFKQFDIEKDLRKSIKKKELLIHFQPRVDAVTGKIVSAEALVRWEHPVWGLVSPNEFIPLAEETGFIVEIGDWVLEQVCHFISSWKQEGLAIVPISINITSQRFIRNDWKSVLFNILKETKVDPSLIELEITETTLILHEKTVEAAFEFLNELGIKIALDDFGTGYSSLSHIKNFSIDTIKIDQSFVSQITKSSNVETIIKSIIFMAKGLNMNIVAEGVETTEQLSFLKQQECPEIQGYIFSKPVEEKTFRSLLKRKVLKTHSEIKKSFLIDRRNYYRINLLFPLSAQMTLISIQGKQVELGNTEILIEDIGPGGIRFLSTIHLPIRPDILFQLETTLLGEPIKLMGHMVWKNEVKDVFQYGLQFSLDEHERGNLIKILNHFSLQLKKHPNVSDSHFITDDKFCYLKKINTIVP